MSGDLPTDTSDVTVLWSQTFWQLTLWILSWSCTASTWIPYPPTDQGHCQMTFQGFGAPSIWPWNQPSQKHCFSSRFLDWLWKGDCQHNQEVPWFSAGLTAYNPPHQCHSYVHILSGYKCGTRCRLTLKISVPSDVAAIAAFFVDVTRRRMSQ
jgi:hypothetical protein